MAPAGDSPIVDNLGSGAEARTGLETNRQL